MRGKRWRTGESVECEFIFLPLRLKGKLTELFVDVVVIHRKGDFFLFYEQLGLVLKKEGGGRKGHVIDKK